MPLFTKQKENKSELQSISKKLGEMPPFSQFQNNLSRYLNVAQSYLRSWDYLRPVQIESNKRAHKYLITGRVLLISHKQHYNKLGVIVEKLVNKNLVSYKVLVLKNQQSCTTEADSKPDNWYRLLSLSHTKIFVPEGVPSHEVVTIAPLDILEITLLEIKADFTLVMNDWNKRQLPRFKYVLLIIIVESFNLNHSLFVLGTTHQDKLVKR